MSALVMDDLFEGRSVPRWLRAFERDPDAALDALLLGHADLGHLNAAEPSDLLLDWLRALSPDFGTFCDAALARWIERSWGRPVSGDATVVSIAWVTACEVIAGTPGLSRAAAALRERVLAERHVLGALVEGRARDPEGRAWLALARHQADASLASEWWRLCRLPPDEPWYRGAYGLHGLQGLPPEQPGRGGGFASHVAEGLRVLALALIEREREGWLRPHDGEREFVPVARLTLASYPFPEKWRAFWDDVLRREERMGDELRAWVRKVDASLAPREPRPAPVRPARLVRDPRWVPTGQAIRAELQAASGVVLDAAIQKARALLLETERYAHATDDTYFIVRNASSFAAALRRTRPALALEWARLAREFEPWNAYTWTTIAECALAFGDPALALPEALEATRRFPDDAVARTGLAEVLKAQGNLDQAEAVYREVIERFADDRKNSAYARTGLAQLLRERGRFDEARRLYEEVLARSPDAKNRQIAQQGLDAIRRRTSRPIDAGGASITAPDLRSPWPVVARDAPAPDDNTGAEHADDEQAPPPESPPPTLRADDVPHLLCDAYLLRRFGLALEPGAPMTAATGRLRQRARGVLGALQPRLERDARSAGEAALLELTLGDLDEAAALLRAAARRFPGSARVRYAWARVERERARRDDDPDPRRVRAPWQRLERLDPRFRPVAWLGESRGWLAWPASADVDAAAREALGQFAHWLSSRAPAAAVDPTADADGARGSAHFLDWWQREVRAQVFGDLDVRRAEDLPDLAPVRANVARDPLTLDHLEMDYVDRSAAA